MTYVMSLNRAELPASSDKLVQAGMRSILNYAPISLNVPANVKVQYIDPAIGL